MPSNSKLNVKFDGIYAIVSGDCPVCDWTEEHTHLKEFLHEYAQTRAGLRQQNSTAPRTVSNLPMASIASPSTPAPISRYVPPVVRATTTSDTPASTVPKTTATTKPKKKEINVYRVRTISELLSVDKTVTGERRKAAVTVARNSHSRQMNIPIEQVSIVFARYIGKYEIPEPSRWQSSSQGGGGMAGHWDEEWGFYGGMYLNHA